MTTTSKSSGHEISIHILILILLLILFVILISVLVFMLRLFANRGTTKMRWVAGIFIVIATALPDGAQAPPAQKNVPDYYPLKPGATWTYDLDPGNGRKIRVTNQIARIETIDGKSMARVETVINGRVALTQHLLSTPEGVFRCRMSDADVSPPLCFLKYPFKEGETWKAEPVIGNEHSQMSFKNGRHEELTSSATRYRGDLGYV